MVDVIRVADGADVIVNGYAFTRVGIKIRVLNLENPERAAVYNGEQELLSSSMDEIEEHIVSGYLARSMKYMEG